MRRPEPPPATVILELTEEEARAVRNVLDGEDYVGDLRMANEAVYAVIDALATDDF
jgi:hypothetical protein